MEVERRTEFGFVIVIGCRTRLPRLLPVLRSRSVVWNHGAKQHEPAVDCQAQYRGTFRNNSQSMTTCLAGSFRKEG